MLYLESYGSGSHLRAARLLQRHSAHRVDLVYLDRAHWRWLALTGHRDLRQAIRELDYPRPDAVICSGPADVRHIAALLPASWRQPPLVAYFHESQWTYPDPELDPRPYLVAHLEALERADHVWFNSRYHRRVFHMAALDAPSLRVRRLAREVIAETWHKTRVLHPPVEVTTEPVIHHGAPFTIAWAARWEREKRPDLFVDALLRCIGAGLDPRIQLLGIPAGLAEIEAKLPPEIRDRALAQSGFPDRAGYEAALAVSDIWVSTAEHEFFGVAALEAALLGATPLLPRALAYPETLPSAPAYPAGDTAVLAEAIARIASRPFTTAPWQTDAGRFLAPAAAARFDSLVAELIDA